MLDYKIGHSARFDRREEAHEAMAGLNGVIPETGTEPLCVKIAEEHGKQKAAYYAGWQAGFTQSRGESSYLEDDDTADYMG
jgi:hypothetical protein